jgi:multicomponent Na+:H+ antiporter subunit B
VSRTLRMRLLLASLAAMGALAVWAVAGLPDFARPRGAYGRTAIALSLHDRHTTNTVSAVAFDIRGFDTFGEELILFCAVVGAALLLRAQRRHGREAEAAEEHEAQRARVSSSLRALGALLAGPLLVLGGYVIAHGAITPGGGFQGGVILASALILAFAAGQMISLRRGSPVSVLEVAEAAGAAAYGLVAIGGLVFAGAAMANFLPAGTQATLVSAGTIPVLNVAVGVEVASGVTLILTELLDQALLGSGSGEA